MANEFYNHGANPISTSNGSSQVIRDEFNLVEDGFDKWPPFTGNANKAAIVNATGTALSVSPYTISFSASLSSTGAFDTEFVAQQDSFVNLPHGNGQLLIDTTFPGFIGGLEMANSGGDVTNDIFIANGICASNNADPATAIILTSSRTKQLDASWVTGTNQGGRCSPSLANGTWHVFAISVSGVADVCFDDNPTGTNIAASTGAQAWRRIGSIIRAAGAIVLFDQLHNLFLLRVSTTDVSTNNPGTSAVTATLASIPNGLYVEANIAAKIVDTTASVAVGMLITPTDVTDTVPTTNNAQLISDANAGASITASIRLEVYTDTSRQIRYRLSSSNTDITVDLVTIGWLDVRGQYGGL